MSLNKGKIALIIPTLKQGGAERVISELANTFYNEGYSVLLILLSQGTEDFYELNSGILIYRLKFEGGHIRQKVLSLTSSLFNLRSIILKENPDAVLSFGDKYNVYTLLATKFLKTKIFISDRSNPKRKIPRSTEILRKYLYKYATGIIAQTALAKEILEQKTNSKNIRIIPNPLKEIKKYPGIEREKIILNVGRLVPQKGQTYLLEAFSKIKDKSWRLVLLGSGPLLDALQKQAIELGIQDSVSFPGAVKNVDEWLARASIFAFPSISEGFPNALIEAMGAGLPCVSFDCDAGPGEIIKDGENGILLPVQDTEALSKAIDTLVSDPHLRHELGRNAEQTVQQFSINAISEQYLNFFSGKLH